MRFPARLAIVLSVTAFLPFTATAQSPSTQSAPTPAMSTPVAAAVPVAAGPRVESASVAFQPVSVDSSSTEAQRRAASQNLGQARAMMIVGGAAVVVGIIIGDDIGTLIAVSGAVIGLYGLYQYLK